MRYFIDVSPANLSVMAEDGRELTVLLTDPEAAAQVAAFADPSVYGKPTLWLFDKEAIGADAHALVDIESAKDIQQWAKDVGSPTLPEKPRGRASGRWVQDAWAFLCRYTGESVAAEPLIETIESKEE